MKKSRQLVWISIKITAVGNKIIIINNNTINHSFVGKGSLILKNNTLDSLFKYSYNIYFIASVNINTKNKHI